jgi:glutaredoxin 3
MSEQPISQSTRTLKAIVYSSPFCGYCGAAKRLLANKGLEVEEIDIVFDPAQRETMLQLTQRQTVPQIFIDDVHIGGYDDLRKLDQSGELDKLIADANIPATEQ